MCLMEELDTLARRASNEAIAAQSPYLAQGNRSERLVTQPSGVDSLEKERFLHCGGNSFDDSAGGGVLSKAELKIHLALFPVDTEI